MRRSLASAALVFSLAASAAHAQPAGEPRADEKSAVAPASSSASEPTPSSSVSEATPSSSASETTPSAQSSSSASSGDDATPPSDPQANPDAPPPPDSKPTDYQGTSTQDAPPIAETFVYATARRASPARRLSGEELMRRGAETLADALNLLPNTRVRQGGRGDFRIDLRGARQGAIRVFVDGVPMEDPYLGRFDVSSVPISDVVEIRVYAAPLSPMDGTGGAGGWIEVETLSPSGAPRLDSRVRAGYPLMGRLSLTGRHPISENFGARLSASIAGSRMPYAVNQADGSTVPFDASVGTAYAALRVDGSIGKLRLWADAGAYHGCQDVPPGEDVNPRIQKTCPQTSVRSLIGARFDDQAWSFAANAYGLFLGRNSLTYRGPEDVVDPLSNERVDANRVGGLVRLSRALGKGWRVGGRVGVERESALVSVNAGNPAQGSTLTLQPAAELTYESLPVRGSLALGGMLAFAPGAPAWPEAKLAMEFRPLPGWTASTSGAMKGRLPTLRERFDPALGNTALGPELHYYVDAEIRRADPLLSPRVTAFHRWTNGLIQLDPQRLRLTNLERMRSAGVELALDINRNGFIGGGAAYNYLFTTTDLENQPWHQATAYLVLTRERFGSMLRFQLVGKRPESGVLLDPYGIFDFSGWVRITKLLRVTARVDNVLDTRYQQRATLLASGRSISLGLELTLQ